MLADIRDFVAGLEITTPNNVYMGILDAKPKCSIGVYNSKRANPFYIPLGGRKNAKHFVKMVTLLVHWNESPRKTEEAAYKLAEALANVSEVTINDEIIYFAIPSEPVDVSTDENGIFEMVIDVDFYLRGEI